MLNNNWTEPLEELLVTWAEKASGYAWLHQQSVLIYKKRNKFLSIPSSIFSYVGGITILLSNDILLNCENSLMGKIVGGIVGVISITSGILSNLQETFTFKEEAEKHRIAALRFLSFFREISCDLSLEAKYRSAPIDYITLKRFELDKILEQSPDIPTCVIKQFNDKFKKLNIHKPDPVTGLQTIIPYGKEIKYSKARNLKIDDKILLLKCFTDWKIKTKYGLLKKGKSTDNTDIIVEIANSRNSNRDEDIIEIENKNIKVEDRDIDHLILHGTLSKQKRFLQNQNIKIKKSAITPTILNNNKTKSNSSSTNETDNYSSEEDKNSDNTGTE